MKKVVNVFDEKAEGLETNKRITKNVSENIHRVDSIVSSARSISLLFNIQAISARIRLRDACERAFIIGLSSMSSQTQRMEEILWRKVYYEPVSAAKKMRKGSTWSEIEEGLIWTHLNDGIAYYHHLLMTLVAAANSSKQYTADLLPFSHSDNEPSNQLENEHLMEALFRSLTCLGDLARYMLDIPYQISSKNTYLLSVRYYHQALHYNCEGGLTHSNLATVYSTNNHPLLAAVHYMRAITCEKPFEAAEGNLRRMLDKSRIWLENKKIDKGSSSKEGNLEKQSTEFLHTSLALLSCFVNNRRMEEVAVLCQEVLLQLGRLLDDYDNVEPPDLSESSSGEGVCLPLNLRGLNGCVVDSPHKHLPLPESSENPKAAADGDQDREQVEGDETAATYFILTPESMVALCAMFILCVKRLKMEGSSHSNMSEVLLVSILLTLVSHINTRLEQKISLIDPTFVQKLLPPQDQAPSKMDEATEIQKTQEEGEVSSSPLCNGDKGKRGHHSKRNKLAKLRRRRKNMKPNQLGPDDDSEAEEGNDGEDDSNDSTNEMEVTSSGDEVDEYDFDPSVLCSSEDDESDDGGNAGMGEEWVGMTEEEHLQLVEQEGMLAAVHVMLQWLLENEQLIKMCGQTAHNLWTSLAKLFNLIRVDYDKLDTSEASSHKKLVLSRLQELKSESFIPEDESLQKATATLPENVMLHLVIPSFQRPCPTQTIKITDMNLLRLYRMNAIIFQVCSREDTPFKLKDNRYFSCEENMKNPSEGAKTENDKNTPETRSGRATPSHPVGVNAASLTSSTKLDDEINSTNSSAAPWSCSSSSSTPKRTLQPPVGSKIASSMQSLTAQWLQHEVRSLEEKTNRRMKLDGLYLVPDASVLIFHLPVLKQMLTTPSHMIIIPQVVIDSLDQQKRESLGARDAIRWLEVKLRHGSRFMRPQRPHEKSHLPLVKYPKRKDKEAWEWFHLAECCYYLGAQLTRSEPKSSTVTLLTSETSSNKLAKRSFSLQTLAEAAGAVLQSVDEFVRKWQISTKGHS